MGACRECRCLFMFENVEPEVRNPMERLFKAFKVVLLDTKSEIIYPERPKVNN